ncbi:MAG TPA: helix-turn-helix transcriptional regulator [Vicinamibacterales bacterium]|jgi:DNA-binding PadR family transcriptional regulator
MDDPRRLLPLTPQQFHILLALTDGQLHGYAILQDIAGRTDGTLRMGTGTLYTALARLEALELVIEADRRPAPVHDDERRRYYALTAAGRAVLQAETARLDALLRQARRKGITPAQRPILSRTK